MTTEQLTNQDHAILTFERQWWKFAGAKETAVLDRFGVTSTRYYQRLNWIIDHPDALATEPLVVRRLLRLRDARTSARTRR
ncbi:hypothetical protein NPS01_25720 [Nocardioides psychrotolerans]|uniref:DUF3263 domain-containing protein n=1 Tax=Nocardioides psychrotolerans TaxID=1005945 RepID=A0A1I3LSR4_9ACTN|nr:DUF3263 domain-containing protein [Nocardioides psychrotolerans]GEP38909.1 hypothetical protein NPS01_25720 [Nocardioides psychrotolerans]SFI87772.1 Protein of unknown function [Nocardioides psychrotolerans]